MQAFGRFLRAVGMFLGLCGLGLAALPVAAQAAQNGRCGLMNMQLSTTAPEAGMLCFYGKPTSVTGSGPWHWSCQSAGGKPVQCSTLLRSTQATRAWDFLDTLGTNGTPLNQKQADTLIKELHYTGITHQRISANSGLTPIPASVYTAICRAGIHIDLASNWVFWLKSGVQGVVDNTLKVLESVNSQIPGCIDTIEGVNEPDLNAAFGKSNAQRQSVADAITIALWKTIKPLYPNIPIAIWPAGIDYYAGDARFSRRNLAAYADYCNLHDYYVSRRYSGNTWAGGDVPGSLQQWIGCRKTMPGKPVISTEVGFQLNGTGKPSTVTVNADTQAKYDMNKIMDHALLGMPQTYLFTLQSNSPGGFGLFDMHGTPRESAAVFHNLTTLLQDPAANARTFKTSSLNYTVNGLSALHSGFEPTGHVYLIQKADGSFWVLIWNEADTWNYMTQKENVIPPVQVTLALPKKFSGSVFDPFGCHETQSDCNPSAGTSPVTTFSNTDDVPIKLTDHMIIVKLDPG